MTIRFPSILFSVIGILGFVPVLILAFIKGVGGQIPFEHLIVSHGAWDAFVTAAVITSLLGVLSLVSGVTLRKGYRFVGFLGLITSILTILLGLLGTYTKIIPLDPRQMLSVFYMSLIPIGILMLISILIARREIWQSKTP